MALLTEFFLFFIQFMFCMGILKFVLGFFFKKKQNDAINATELHDQLIKLIHFIKQEQHGTQLYWFDSNTEEFLGQGSSFDTIVESIKSRFPNHIFINEDANAFLSAPEWVLRPISEIKKEVSTDNIQFKD